MQGSDGERFLKASNHRRRQPLGERPDRKNGGEQNHGNPDFLVFLPQAGEHPLASAPEKFLVEHEQVGSALPELGQAIEPIRGRVDTIACVQKIRAVESGCREVRVGDQQALFHGTPPCRSN